SMTTAGVPPAPRKTASGVSMKRIDKGVRLSSSDMHAGYHHRLGTATEYLPVATAPMMPADGCVAAWVDCGMANERPTHQEVVDATAAAQATMRPQNVPVNMYETTGAVVVVAPLPAVTAKDVTIELRPGQLRFWAALRSAGPRDFLLREWDYGGYEREIP